MVISYSTDAVEVLQACLPASSRWTVLAYAGPVRGGCLWLCKCECGTEKVVLQGKLKNGESRSCGCLQRELASTRRKTHGRSGTVEYNAWFGMRARCGNPKHNRYADWGGRGIKVCARWSNPKTGFENFLKDTGLRPGPGYSVERRNNEGDYKPSNCYWGTRSEQAANRRSSVIIEWQGRRQCLRAWAKEVGLTDSGLARRLKLGWSVQAALTTPPSNRGGPRRFSEDERRLRRRARQFMNKALQGGRLIKPDRCEVCHKRTKLSGHHHAGYTREHWLDVTWVCSCCHAALD
jgi:hypothetical protein